MVRSTALAALCIAAGLGIAGSAVSAPAKKSAPAKPKYSIPATGILDQRAVMHTAFIALRKSEDPFAPDPTAHLSGRQFRISIPIGELNASSIGHWTYDRTAQQFTLTAFQWDGFALFYSQDPAGSYTGTNSYGAKAQIQRFRTLKVNLVPVSQPHDPSSPYSVTIPADPEHGRLLSRSSSIVVEGTLYADGNLGVTSCGTSKGSPTIAAPYDETTTTCKIKADITRVAFVSSSTGDVFREWRIDWGPKDENGLVDAPKPITVAPR